MKKILNLLILFTALPVFANGASFELGGTYSNEEGCSVNIPRCVYFTHPETNELEDQCTLGVSVYLKKQDDDGGIYFTKKSVASIGKNGFVDSVKENLMTIKDQGTRFSSVSNFPSFSNTTVVIKINNTFNYSSSYPDHSVSNFDIVVKKGLFGKEIISCQNLELQEDF